LLKYYGVEPQRTNPASPHENGDADQSHHRFKRAVDQALLLRGSRESGFHPPLRVHSRGPHEPSHGFHPEKDIADKCTLCYHRITKGLTTASVACTGQLTQNPTHTADESRGTTPASPFRANANLPGWTSSSSLQER
jgi:hypothetical protein